MNLSLHPETKPAPHAKKTTIAPPTLTVSLRAQRRRMNGRINILTLTTLLFLSLGFGIFSFDIEGGDHVPHQKRRIFFKRQVL